MPNDKQLVGFDLDGTLAYYDPDDFDPLVVGEPIELMVQTAKRHLKQGHGVYICTARVAERPDEERDIEAVRKAVEDWTEKVLGQRLQVTNEKLANTLYIYDDSVRQVVPNTGITLLQLVAALRRMLERHEANPEYAPEVEQHLEAGDDL